MRRRWIRVVVALVWLIASAAGAVTVVVGPVADAFVGAGSARVGSADSDRNYGAAGALQLAAAGSPAGEMEVLMRFDLSGVAGVFNAAFGAGGWSVQSVTLRLGTNFGVENQQPANAVFNPVRSGSFGIEWLANDAWVEGAGTPAGSVAGGITFNGLSGVRSAGDEGLGTFSYVAAGNTGPSLPRASYGLGLGAGLVADVEAGAEVSLRLFAADAQVAYLFNSRNFAGEANRPELVVVAVPEVRAGWLMLAGVVFAAGRRRR